MSDEQPRDARGGPPWGPPGDDPEPGAGTDSDDTTQADAGMVGGTGAVPAEGTLQPFGTDPIAGDEEQDGEDPPPRTPPGHS